MEKITMFFLVLICTVAYSDRIFAQEVGSVSGIVKDDQGGFLPGATVYIADLQKGEITDRFGKYELTNIQAGNYKLEVSFIGFEKQTIDVSIAAGSAVVADVTLTSNFIELKNVVVTSVRKGNAKALNKQKNAENITNVVSQEEINKYPDISTADAMRRVPGVNVTTSFGQGRYVSIRGTSPGLTSVTVNGQKMSSPVDGERYVGLDVVNASQLEMIEVSKTLTPDMEGDAIGGSVNLLTKTAFDHDRTYLNIKASSGVNTFGSDPLYNTEATYSTLLGTKKNVGITVGGSWNQRRIIGEQNEFSYDESDLPDGTTLPNALQDFYLIHTNSLRNRIGVNTSLDFKTNEDHRFYINGMYNTRSDDMARNTIRYRPGKGDYLIPTTVENARMAFELSARNEVQTITQFSAGGHSDFGGLVADYSVSYGYADENKGDTFKSEWQLDEKPNFLIDNSDVDFPVFTATSQEEDYSYDAAHWEIDKQDWRDTKSTNENVAANIDFANDFIIGSGNGALKFGGKYRKETKTRNNTRSKYTWEGDDISMAAVSVGNQVTDFLDEKYVLSPMVDYDRYEDFFYANRDQVGKLEADPVYDDTDGIGGAYSASESITAAYLMATARWGRFKAMVGVRDEYTMTSYEGVELKYDPGSGDLTGHENVEIDNNYNMVFPHLHLQYDFSPHTDLRFAATTGIARPRYFELAPYFWQDDNVITKGNVDLKPTKSTNFDLMFGHYFKGIGVFNFGLFAKQLQDIIYENAYLERGGLYDGYIIKTTVNGDNASLYGFEVSWMQQFTFLPGFASGFGIYANYTYTESNTEIERTDEDENIRHISSVPGQLGNVGNIGLNYEKNGFNARLSYNFAEDYLYDVRENEAMDRFKDAYSQLDFTCSYEFKRHIELFANVMNITNSNNREYFEESSRPRVNQFIGTTFMAGLKFTL